MPVICVLCPRKPIVLHTYYSAALRLIFAVSTPHTPPLVLGLNRLNPTLGINSPSIQLYLALSILVLSYKLAIIGRPQKDPGGHPIQKISEVISYRGNLSWGALYSILPTDSNTVLLRSNTVPIKNDQFM